MSFDDINTGDLGRDLQAQEQKPRGWWSRNWKWFVPTLLLAMIIMCCGCPAAIIFSVIGIFRNSEPYLDTMQKIQADPQVQEAFGQPIRDNSWIPAGELNMPDGQGNAELRLGSCRPEGKRQGLCKSPHDQRQMGDRGDRSDSARWKKIVLHEEGGGNEAPAFQGQGAAEGEKNARSRPRTRS